MSERKSSLKHLSDEARLAKNQRIREAGLATRARRASMKCRVYHLKIQESSLSKTQKLALKSLFQEYKWVRNAALAAQRFDVAYASELGGKVSVLTPKGLEQRQLRWLGSQMQQAAVASLGRDLKALAAHKSKGYKVGKLKFVRDVNSIELQQQKITYELYSDARGRYTKARVQNIPGRLRLRGFEQLSSPGIEFSNAKLIRKPSGYYIAVTTYIPQETSPPPANELGIDFGVRTSFTLSDGSSESIVIEEGERLRRLQRKLSRQVKGSNGYDATRAKLAREHERLTNRKDELARQLVHSWTTNSVVYFQDEQISSWKTRDSGSRGSRKIHHGVLGRVKTLLKRKPGTVLLPSWVATTAWCPQCGARNPQELSQRTYECVCGYSAPRDLHAAKNMVTLGKRYKTITSGTEGSAGGASIRLKDQLYAVTEQLAAKPETTTASVSP